jgi:D-glycero-D-manno-heptose 1,7-bisphosphate phosphatase
MTRRAVFLDLNGTLVMPVQVDAPATYQPIPGSIQAVRLLNRAGFLCPVVTIQSRIEKGLFSEQAFLDWFKLLQGQFRAQQAELLGPYLCPHRRSTACVCRKPQPALYLQAAEAWDIDCSRSYVVGDTLDDIRAGQQIGAKTSFVRTGWAIHYISDAGHEADFVGEDILAVAQWIVANA